MWHLAFRLNSYSENAELGVISVVQENVKKQAVSSVLTGHPVGREKIRWMMVFYDSIVYLICGLTIFLLHPSMQVPVPYLTACFYLTIGYILFFGFRFIFKCYKRIWRYGSIHAFSREILAGVLGASCLVGLGLLFGRVFLIAGLPVMLLASFAAIYVIVSILIRVVYCYLFRFAEKDTPLARVIRYLIERGALVDFNSKLPGATLRIVLESEIQYAAPINELQNIAEKFAIRGNITSITQINKGYINRTYRVETLSDTGHVHKYTLQRINTNVFPDVDALMENVKLTTNHLCGKLHLSGYHKRGSVPMLRTTKDGRAYFRDDSGCWRMMTYFDGVCSMDIPDSPETFYRAGCAFGGFVKEMADVDIQDIKMVIPNFHNTKSRYLDLEEAISKDPKDRVKNVAPEIKFVRDRADKYGMISDALESGKIPTRICHNDCNLNNILFDNETRQPVAIIDLDTVMPSSPLYDYGDSMRIGTNTAKDDEKDLSKVSCDLNLYEQYARGYLEACGDMLTKEELELLPYASLVITAEDGIRFLTDHINGDTYYNIYYPGQNLDRARTQLKLVEDMEKKLPQIKQILHKIYDKLGLDVNID